MIELRSDTFTVPSREMLESILETKLGDNVYNEDTAVLELEELAANLLNKEASLLLPSGTMANLASIMGHSNRGTSVIVGEESDIFIYEAGGASVSGGVIYEPITTNEKGEMDLAKIEAKLNLDFSDPQYAKPSLICVETPHNRMGGITLSLEYLKELYSISRRFGVPIHMDGARIFNAAISLDVEASEISQYADSIQFCLSKGLGAPIGSLVVGKKKFINKIYYHRKMLGGGMRQSGIIAAPGIYALNNRIDRLKEDHENAFYFAKKISSIKGIRCDIKKVKTNTVIFNLKNEYINVNDFIKKAWEKGLNISEIGNHNLRVVTYYSITKKILDDAVEKIEEVLKEYE
ncbi:threonine aldolase [Virgibacillus pantothenticus]|uniref:GntG family PLP-dependent aldolase n=1 Tax=Virgibacillus pantothenticus TaxID=1473 RepID=UPI001B155DDC|nr:GntG family PLP-dependent aldolase [Virgibacillus pantothenticus]GIP64031.1 threonine aldolase [Virgibacillus pantothenticus]